MLTFQQWVSDNNLNRKVNEMNNKLNLGNIIYIGAILTKDAQNKLWESISERVAIPSNWKKFCHHMTIRFIGSKPVPDTDLPVFGEEVSLVVTEVFTDDQGICVKVEPNTNKTELHMPSDQIPHITVACAPGVPPIYSNKLLQGGAGTEMTQALILDAFVGAKMKSGGIVPERSDAASENLI